LVLNVFVGLVDEIALRDGRAVDRAQCSPWPVIVKKRRVGGIQGRVAVGGDLAAGEVCRRDRSGLGRIAERPDLLSLPSVGVPLGKSP
jgi:hypothetical protein